MSIKRELEFNSADKTPEPHLHYEDYLVLCLGGGYYRLYASFDPYDNFKYFIDLSDGCVVGMGSVCLWAVLPNATDLQELVEGEEYE